MKKFKFKFVAVLMLMALALCALPSCEEDTIQSSSTPDLPDGYTSMANEPDNRDDTMVC